jgi:hypothetical protein
MELVIYKEIKLQWKVAEQFTKHLKNTGGL